MSTLCRTVTVHTGSTWKANLILMWFVGRTQLWYYKRKMENGESTEICCSSCETGEDRREDFNLSTISAQTMLSSTIHSRVFQSVNDCPWKIAVSVDGCLCGSTAKQQMFLLVEWSTKFAVLNLRHPIFWAWFILFSLIFLSPDVARCLW